MNHPTSMTAAVHDTYGPPEVVATRVVERPTPTPDRVVIRVHAASVNPFDVHMLTGMPLLARMGGGWRRPTQPVLGVDMAGTVVEVGADVTDLTPGDEVFGGARGAFAEYTVAKATGLARRPQGLDVQSAAALPMAGLTALQALRDKGGLQAGERVLINGAAGGIGTLAVQIAKALGAHVTGVCSAANVELVRSLGADRVIDYTTEDYTSGHERYDVFVDNVGNRSLTTCKRLLAPKGRYIIVSGPKKNRLVGPAMRIVRAKLVFALGSRSAVPFMSRGVPADLDQLATWAVEGTVKPVIDRTYPLDQAGSALEYVATGHARAKVVITVE